MKKIKGTLVFELAVGQCAAFVLLDYFHPMHRCWFQFCQMEVRHGSGILFQRRNMAENFSFARLRHNLVHCPRGCSVVLMYELIVAANILLYKCLWQVGAVQWHWRSPHGPLKENQATFLRPKKDSGSPRLHIHRMSRVCWE